jgi:hypothetical protein
MSQGHWTSNLYSSLVTLRSRINYRKENPMRIRIPAIPATVLYLTIFVLLSLVLASCGGGEDQPGSGGQDGGNRARDGGAPGEEGGGGEAVKKKAPKVKSALGTVMTVNPDKRRIVLRPNSEIQGGKRMFFKVTKKTEINLDDKEAELADAKRGQQAQIEYIAIKMVENERNRARVVQLFSDGKSGEEPG